MKKVILTALALVSLTIANAQTPLKTTISQLETIDIPAATSIDPVRHESNGQTKAVVVWSEDFGNGWPAGWTNESSNALDWQHS